jgi:type IIS restriction enzyme M protein
MAKIQSVEPNIADLANGWLKSYKLDYKLEQESLNTEIDQALNDYYSKMVVSAEIVPMQSSFCRTRIWSIIRF